MGNEFQEEVNTTKLMKLERNVSDIYSVFHEYCDEGKVSANYGFVRITRDYDRQEVRTDDDTSGLTTTSRIQST
jgi:hypothetical protein